MMNMAARLSTLTLLITLLSLLALASPILARDVAPIRREHVRLVKMWGPPPELRNRQQNGDVNILGFGDPSNTGSSSGAGATATSGKPTNSAPANGGSSTAPPASSSTPAQGNGKPTDGGLGGFLGGIFGGSSTVSTANTGATSTGTTTTLTTTTTTTTTTSTLSTTNVSSIPESLSTPTTTSTRAPLPSLTPEEVKQDSKQTRLSPKTIKILIVIGSVLAGVGILWTLFRKYSLSGTKSFKNRLQPIDWEPSNDMGERRHSLGAGSFRSGPSNDAASVRRNMFAPDDPVSMAPDFPPPHDFTAGSHLARGPSGGHGGYVGTRGY